MAGCRFASVMSKYSTCRGPHAQAEGDFDDGQGQRVRDGPLVVGGERDAGFQIG